MLPEERLEKIVELVQQRSSVTNLELTQLLDASESTIRRDITFLAAEGRILKVHGGAMAMATVMKIRDEDMHSRRGFQAEEKQRIGRYAAELIGDEDLVFLDAGSSTEYLISFLPQTRAIFVTNAVGHATALAQKGLTVYLLGGRMKSVTEAIVGSETVLALNKYNFSKGFFGTNGISPESGLTTPDIDEAAIKEHAAARCRERYVLCDSSKFGQISPISFARFKDVRILTDRTPQAYKKYANIQEVPK